MELVKFEKTDVVELFMKGETQVVLDAIKKEVKSFAPDLETKKGRADIASLAHKVARSKTYLEDIGKGIVAEWKAKSKKVDSERKHIRETLDDLKEEIRRPLTDFENKEKERVAKLDARLEEFKAWLYVDPSKTSKELKQEFSVLADEVIGEDWEELQLQAGEIKSTALALYKEAIDKKVKEEHDAAELARLRAEDEKRKKEEHERKLKEEAAAKAKAEAERKAKEEHDRIEREKKEAEERERKAKEAAAKAEQERIEAEKRAKEAEERAEKERAAAKKKAEAEKIKAAEDAARRERERIEQENQRKIEEQRKKEADLKHRKKIKVEAETSFCMAGFTEKDAANIVSLIAEGSIQNVTINY